MNWKDIRDRKEDSLRESTNNPMVKKPNPFEHNGKIYKSFSDYLNSEEYKEFLKIQEESKDQYTQMAKEYFHSLENDNQLLLFFLYHKCYFRKLFQ
jgi:hypothetical protein